MNLVGNLELKGEIIREKCQRGSRQVLAGADIHIVQIRERNTIKDLMEMGRCERFDIFL